MELSNRFLTYCVVIEKIEEMCRFLRGVGTELGQNDENGFLTLSTYSNGPEPA